VARLTAQRRERIAGMRLSYAFDHSLSADLVDGGEVVQPWWVRVDEAEAEDGTAGALVAGIHIVRGRLGEPGLWEALDALEADLEVVASTILDPGLVSWSMSLTSGSSRAGTRC
jgi:hypothetical protein